MPEESDHQSDPGDPANSQSESECSKETASEIKLGTVTPTRSVEEYYEEPESSNSYCLVELSSLMNTF